MIKIVVSSVILDDNFNVLLGKSQKWNGAWTIPGGKVNLGETLEEALKREVYEETSLEIENINFLKVSESIYDPQFKKGKDHMIFIDFYCNPISKKVIIDNVEFQKYKWVNIREALETLTLSKNTKMVLLTVENIIR